MGVVAFTGVMNTASDLLLSQWRSQVSSQLKAQPQAQAERVPAEAILQNAMQLALLTSVGLLSALLGDGIWDALSWLALVVPVALCVFHWARPANRVCAGTKEQ